MINMKPNAQRMLFVDTRLDQYQSFFDHSWAKQFLEHADTKGLTKFAMDLLAAWKGAANSYRLIWMTVEIPAQVTHGFVAAQEPVPQRLLTLLAARLSRKIESGWKPRHHRQLLGILKELNSDIERDLKAARCHFDRNVAWEKYLEHSEFIMSVVALVRATFCNIFFAYEDFIVRCVSQKLGRRCRVGPHFAERVKFAFGHDVADECWKCDVVHNARLVRHALTHAGGRETNELRTSSHCFLKQDGDIHIQAEDVWNLYSELKKRSDLLLRAM